MPEPRKPFDARTLRWVAGLLRRNAASALLPLDVSGVTVAADESDRFAATVLKAAARTVEAQLRKATSRVRCHQPRRGAAGVKRKDMGLVREAKKEGLARRTAAHAKAFDAVVAGRPLKPLAAVEKRGERG